MGYCAVDSRGRQIGLPEVDQQLPKALSFDDLKELALHSDCDVLLVAHSAEKAAGVEAAVLAGVSNTLIVDEVLAEALIHRISDQ